ncbi:MAG: hypothetical protein RLP97_11230 [Coleofasciculus chthonoplastes F2-STO-03]
MSTAIIAVLSYNNPGAAVATIDRLVQLGDMAVELLLFGATATGDGRSWVGNRFLAPLAVFPSLVPTQGTKSSSQLIFHGRSMSLGKSTVTRLQLIKTSTNNRTVWNPLH